MASQLSFGHNRTVDSDAVLLLTFSANCNSRRTSLLRYVSKP